jgi:hypothetical protein
VSEQPEWFRTYLSGLAKPDTYSVFLESEHYAVVKEAAGRVASGYAGSAHYMPACYTLVRKGGNYWHAKVRVVWEGRLTKAGRTAMETALEVMESLEPTP